MLVNEFHGTTQVALDASPADVFALITDVDRLPEWNAHVHHVITPPDAPLAAEVEWVIEMRAMGTRWPSRSHATVVDADNLRFEHTSRSDDGNPSYAVWSWQVSPRPGGSELTVTWAGYPRSVWRRALFARIRAPQLEAEAQASLSGLNDYLNSRRQR
jgi:uncharacterized protein YndB with AHSA1/START domain